MISAAAVTAGFFFVPGLANCASWISIPLERRDLNTKDACVCGRWGGGSGCHVSSFPFHAFWTPFFWKIPVHKSRRNSLALPREKGTGAGGKLDSVRNSGDV